MRTLCTSLPRQRDAASSDPPSNGRLATPWPKNHSDVVTGRWRLPLSPLSRLAVLQHSVSQNAGDLTDYFVGVLAKVVFDAEDNLDGKVVVEDSRRQHHGGRRRKTILQAAGKLLFHPVLLDECVEAQGHIAVELANVRAVELDDIDVDERDVGPVVLHGFPRGAAELFEILRKRSLGERAVERKLRIGHGSEILVEQLAEDRLFVVEAMVDVPLRHTRIFGYVTHARGAIAAMRKQLERCLEDLGAAALGALFLVHLGCSQGCRDVVGRVSCVVRRRKTEGTRIVLLSTTP